MIIDRWKSLRLLVSRFAELPAELAELGRQVRGYGVATEAVLAVLTRPRPRWAQLMLLWHEAEMPGFCSLCFDLHDPNVRNGGARSDPMMRPVPAGAWLVAVGCTCSQVMIGNQLQDFGSVGGGLQLRVLRLPDAIQVGVCLRARVQPDDG